MLAKNFCSAVLTMFMSLSLTAISCTPAATPSPAPTPSLTQPTAIPGGPGGGAIVNSDSVTTGKIVAIRTNLSPGYPSQIDIEVQKSMDIGSLPNPTKDKVGLVITCSTDQDVSPLKVGQVITGNVKYVGDVPKPGITLYISSFRAS